ncbi:MAG: hypothetical protein AAF821_23865 [Cyanobacteria bacterium P01_D01_bin.156]
MKSKFSPKFTIVTPYLMMFSVEDLKCVELEVINILFEEETTSPQHVGYSIEHDLPINILSKSESDALLEKESGWLQQLKQQLESLLEIEVDLDKGQDTPWSSAGDPILPLD